MTLGAKLSSWNNGADTGRSVLVPSCLSFSERQDTRARLLCLTAWPASRKTHRVEHAVVATNRKRGEWAERCGGSRAVEAASCPPVVHEQQALPRAPGIHGRTDITWPCQRIKGTDNW